MILQFLSPFTARFSALPIDPGYSGSCFHFLSLDLSRGIQRALFFMRLSFPPLVARMGRQPRGMGIGSHFKRLLAVEDQ
jgi:hypothetical protein